MAEETRNNQLEETTPELTAHFPVLEPRPTIRSFHGDDFSDDYEWIRNAPEAEVLAYVRAENDYYAAQTAHLADLRKQLVSEYAAHTQEDDFSVPTRRGTYWYWSETCKGVPYPRLWRVPVADFPQRPLAAVAKNSVNVQLVYDANILAEGAEFFAIGSVAISEDGQLCALAIDRTGGETFQIRIHEIATGVIIDDGVREVTYGLVFNADASRIYYLRADAAWRSCELWVHQVGVTASHDVLLWRENDERFEVWIEQSRDRNWLLLNTSSRTTSEVYLLDLRSAKTDSAENEPLQDLTQPAPFTLAGRHEGVEYYVERAGAGLLVTHNLRHSDFEIAAVPGVEPFDLAQLPVVFTPNAGERVVEIAGFADFAAFLLRAAGAPQIRILRYSPESAVETDTSWQVGEIVPSETGQTLEFGANYLWEARTLHITREALITPPTVSEYCVDSRELQDLQVTPVPNFDPQQYVEYIEWATAADGTRLPITIAHRADLQRDGKNPGYVYGYGSYEVCNDPWFNAQFISLLDRGVVLAITHLRGGGEFGRAWYEQGKLLEKRNTFTDFIDATRHLVEIGLIDRQRIAAEGRSAGGLLMGAVANLAPELYRVVLAGVPFVDALTTILKPELPLTVGEWEEWGNPLDSAQVYEYMKSYSPYENIAEVEYPAILATTSLNDVRVSFLEPTKWVAALRAKTQNYLQLPTQPILLKTELVAGHAGGSGRYQRWENRAAEHAFVLDQLGLR